MVGNCRNMYVGTTPLAIEKLKMSGSGVTNRLRSDLNREAGCDWIDLIHNKLRYRPLIRATKRAQLLQLDRLVTN